MHPTDENVLDSAFVKVINVEFYDTMLATIDSIPFLETSESLHMETVVSVPKTKSINVLPCQQYTKDVGHTTGKCLIEKDNLGLSLPV